MLKFAILISIILLAAIGFTWFYFNNLNNDLNNKINEVQRKIDDAQAFIDAHPGLDSNGSFDEGVEMKIGLTHNKNVYSYYSIVGTEIPKKLWLTHLKLDDHVYIDGQADNLESVYSFYRNIKDYVPESNVKIQKLGLASNGVSSSLDIDEIASGTGLTSMNADFYEFKISDVAVANDKKESASTKGDKKATNAVNSVAPLVNIE